MPRSSCEYCVFCANCLARRHDNGSYTFPQTDSGMDPDSDSCPTHKGSRNPSLSLCNVNMFCIVQYTTGFGIRIWIRTRVRLRQCKRGITVTKWAPKVSNPRGTDWTRCRSNCIWLIRTLVYLCNQRSLSHRIKSATCRMCPTSQTTARHCKSPFRLWVHSHLWFIKRELFVDYLLNNGLYWTK